MFTVVFCLFPKSEAYKTFVVCDPHLRAYNINLKIACAETTSAEQLKRTCNKLAIVKRYETSLRAFLH